MKKALLTLLVVFSISLSGFAQLFQEGNSYIHFGVGVGSPYYYSGSKMGVPPIQASYEKAIKPNIGLGAMIGYASSSYEQRYFVDSYKWNFSYLIIGARGAYHFTNVTDKADLYVGLMLGYNVATAKFESTDPSIAQFIAEPQIGGVAYGVFGGVRYNLNDKTALFAELGYNISWLSLGLCINM